MKFVLLLLIIVGLSFADLNIPDHLRATTNRMRQACMARVKDVDEKLIDQTKNGNVPDDPALRCYILCILEHSGMVYENGTISFDKVIHLLEPSQAESARYVSAKCATKHGDTLCDTAYLTYKCYIEHAPQNAELA